MKSLPLRQQLRAWSRRQLYSLFSSLGTLVSHRLGTTMTVLVLGIAMVLPVGLLVGLQNLQVLDFERQQWGSLTAFLRPTVEGSQAAELGQRLELAHGASVRLISPEQGLQEFRLQSGFGEALDALESNPLPWLMEIPLDSGDPGTIASQAESVRQWLSAQPEIESVVVDSLWLQRLARMLAVGEALVQVLTGLFSLAVLLVVANTIRLDVANRSDEIEVLSLVGASTGFIRLPFLYSGAWYGLLGALLALVLLYAGLAYLSVPIAELLDSYGNPVVLKGVSWRHTLVLLCGGALLGWCGAWLAVERYLRQIRRDGRLGRI